MSNEFDKQMKKFKNQIEKTKSDIKNWTYLLDQLEADTAERVLMVTKKKADA